MAGVQQKQLDLRPAGAALRDDGIQRAVEHAEDVEQGWADRCRHFFQKFLAQRTKAETFTSLDFRTFAETHGLSPPPDSRAYGGVFQSAVKRGYIVRVGFENRENPTRHNAPVSIWGKV